MNDFKVCVDSKALLDNYDYVKKMSDKEIIAVVKANAYGHGLENVVKILSDKGCRYFAVSKEIEVEDIFKLNIEDIKILLLHKIDNIDLLKENKNLEISVGSLEFLKELLLKGVSPKQVHIKLDFGFGRNGIREEELLDLKRYIKENDLKFKGVTTHLFAAEYDDMIEIERKFKDIIEDIGKDRFEMIHMQNSAGVIDIKADICTHIRCGTTLYGFQDRGYYTPKVKKVFKLVGRVVAIKEIKKLKYIGYEKKEDLNLGRVKKVGIIMIGYGDGFSKMSKNLMTIINNKKYKILNVTMDCSHIIVDDLVKVGDEVEIFYDVEETKEHYGIYSCEFLIRLTNRVKREVI